MNPYILVILVLTGYVLCALFVANKSLQVWESAEEPTFWGLALFPVSWFSDIIGTEEGGGDIHRYASTAEGRRRYRRLMLHLLLPRIAWSVIVIAAAIVCLAVAGFIIGCLAAADAWEEAWKSPPVSPGP